MILGVVRGVSGQRWVVPIKADVVYVDEDGDL